jgi:hypothetical protein
MNYCAGGGGGCARPLPAPLAPPLAVAALTECKGRIRPRQRRAIDTFCLMDEQLQDLPLLKDRIDEATETAPHV